MISDQRTTPLSISALGPLKQAIALDLFIDGRLFSSLSVNPWASTPPIQTLILGSAEERHLIRVKTDFGAPGRIQNFEGEVVIRGQSKAHLVLDPVNRSILLEIYSKTLNEPSLEVFHLKSQ